MKFKVFDIPPKKRYATLNTIFEYKQKMMKFLDALARRELERRKIEEFVKTIIKNKITKKVFESELEGFYRLRIEDNECCWPLIEDFDVESGIRVDFIYEPTYIVVAILSLIYQEYVDDLKNVLKRELEDALRCGLLFSTKRGLLGHGYDCYRGTYNALKIFEKGKVIELLSQKPELCPKMYSLLKEIKSWCSKMIKNEAWKSDSWEVLTEEQYKEIARILDPIR